MKKNCYYCGQELSLSEKPEHIIQNAFGGKLKSKEILCSKCNTELSQIDNSLAQELLFFTNFLNPSRDNGKNPDFMVKMQGVDVNKTPDNHYYGKKVEVKNEGDKKIISNQFFYTPNSKHEKKAFEEIEFLKNNALRNGHSFNIEYGSFSGNEPFFSKITLNESGVLFLGILKIILGFCSLNEIDRTFLDTNIQILKEKNKEALHKKSNFYEPFSFYPTDSIYHTIFIKADKKERLFYALISLFGVCNTFFCLDDKYTGDDFKASYCYDLIEKKEKDFNSDINISRDEIKNILNLSEPKRHHELLTKNMNRFMKLLPVKPYKSFNENLKEQFEERFLQYIKNFENLHCKLLSEQEFTSQIYEGIFKQMEKEGILTICDEDEVKNGLIKSLYHFYINQLISYLSANMLSELFLKEVKISPFPDYEKLKQSILNYRSGNKVFDIAFHQYCDNKVDELLRCTYDKILTFKRMW